MPQVKRELRVIIREREPGIWGARIDDHGLKKIHLLWSAEESFPGEQLDAVIGIWKATGRMATDSEIRAVVFLPDERDAEGRRHTGEGGCMKITYWEWGAEPALKCRHCGGALPPLTGEVSAG